MFPYGHLALGYLFAALVQRSRNRALPQGWVLGAVVVGSQLPDLVDKPLVYFGVLASGRSLGHSLVVVIPFVVLALRVGQRTGYTEHAIGLSVGVLSHLLGDSYRLLLSGQWNEARYLLWPLFPAIEYPADGIPPWVRLVNSVGSPQHRLQYVLIVAAVAVWAYNRYTRRRRQTTT